MRKFLLALGMSLLCTLGFSQTTVYSEDFEGVVNVVSSGNPGWTSNNTYAQGGLLSYHTGIAISDTSAMRTISFSTVGNSDISLKFWHICKVSFFDGGIIEVSNDGGASWIKLTSTEYINNNNSQFTLQGNKFSAAAYQIWEPGVAGALPQASWWYQETFNVSALLANIPNAMVRFRAFDGNGNGQESNYGWLVDNIEVIAAPCELNAPVITLVAPIWQNTVYNLGPYSVNADIVDQSGILDAFLWYTVNGGALQGTLMNNTSGNNFEGIIPGVNDGDTVCYYLEAMDASCASLTTFFPASGTICFNASTGISFPYCDNFDIGQPLWTADPVTGATAWELGTPAFGATNSAHSAPNAWDLNLVAGYGPSAQNVRLVSPVFDFSNAVNAKLEFWQNRNMETGWDGVTLEYTIDGITWQVLGVQNDPNGVNWFTAASVNSSGGKAVWTGNSSGWVKSEYTLVQLNNAVGPVQFRFVFTSDGSVQMDGMSIDDMCITLPAPIDGGVVAINQPGPQVPANTLADVNVRLKNFGSLTLTSIPVEYRIDNGPIIPFTWTGTLAPGDTISTPLPQFTAPVGPFTICAWTALAGDGNTFNDSLCKQSQGLPIVTLTYTDNFDGVPVYWYNLLNPGGNTGSIWELGTPAFGATNSAFSAPNAWDINLNTAYTANANVTLNSPIIDFTGAVNTRMKFKINHNCETGWDGVRLEYSLNGGSTYSVLGVVNDPAGTNWYNNANLNSSGTPGWAGNSNGWVNVEYFLPSIFDNQPNVLFRFVFSSDGSVQQDGFSIDDFVIQLPAPFDAAMNAIVSPANPAAVGSLMPVDVIVKNLGLNTLTDFDVVYDIGAGPVITPWVGSLAAGATVAINLPDFVVPTGAYTFCANVNQAGDGDTTNDTLCRNLVGIPTYVITYPVGFNDNFDGANQGWSNEFGSAITTTSWQLGTPTFGATNSSHTAPNCWDVNLTTAYAGNANARLYTPYFDLTNAVGTIMNFWVNYNTENNWDGVRMEYSINNGAWNLLGVFGQPGATNWYSVANMNSSATPGWAGNSAGWKLSSINLPALFDNVGQVQFRYIFTSDGTANVDGFSLDDFQLDVPIARSVAAQNINTVSPLLLPGSSQTFTAQVKNIGTEPLNTVNFTLEVGGNVIVTDAITLTPALAKNQVRNHTFSLPWIATNGPVQVRAWTSDPNSNTDLDMSDDTTSRIIVVFDSLSVVSGAPYCNDFEGSQNPWVTLNALTYSQNNNNWQLGTPAQSLLNSAHSGTNAWMTKLTANYSAKDSSGLFTPLFNVIGSKCYELEFWHMFRTEDLYDGGTVEYSTDLGITWRTFGSYSPTGSSDWFNTQFITGLGGIPPRAGWSGSTTAWKLAKKEISFTNDVSVIIRFRFGSDNTNHSEGWVIDDVCFTEVPITVCITGINEAPSASIDLSQNYPNPVNGNTVISYTLPDFGFAKIEVMNMLGQNVATPVSDTHSAGTYRFELDVKGWAPGIYSYVLTYGDQRIARKMVVTE